MTTGPAGDQLKRPRFAKVLCFDLKFEKAFGLHLNFLPKTPIFDESLNDL